MTPRPLQRRYVAYYRVSTARQGRSGLGLSAQRSAVEDFLRATGGSLRAEFTETQSGRDNERPKLLEALTLCKLTHSTLLIAKLDRLSRNAAFLLALQEAHVRFVACDMPDMNETVVGIMAVIAQAERKAISERTKAALAAAKAHGVRLGNPHLKPGNRRVARIATKARQSLAQSKAEDLRDVIAHARSSGLTSTRQLAAHLNELGVTSPGRAQWHPTSVSRVLVRLRRD